jgi:hypothetical protein
MRDALKQQIVFALGMLFLATPAFGIIGLRPIPFTASISDTNYTKEQKAKVVEASKRIETIVNSDKFKQGVLDFSYQGKKKFVDTELTNEQVFNKIYEGAETLKPEVNHQMDIALTMYTGRTSTIGYTYPNVLRVWTNSKYHNNYGPCEIVGNVFHEWLHKLGFVHAFRYSSSRDYSVPYALGYMVETMCKNP